MNYEITNERMRSLIEGGTRPHPLGDLVETEWTWGLGTLAIMKHRAAYSDGFGHSLRPESRFYKRWFDFSDLGVRGWAIIFRIFDPVGEASQPYEQFPGWVPPEREADVDRWIQHLNEEIRARFAFRRSKPRSAGSSVAEGDMCSRRRHTAALRTGTHGKGLGSTSAVSAEVRGDGGRSVGGDRAP